MIKLEESGMTFLLVTNNYWCKGDNLPKLKREASRNGTFASKEKRVYNAFLVHQDTTVSAMGDLEFPSTLAAETAMFLGPV